MGGSTPVLTWRSEYLCVHEKTACCATYCLFCNKMSFEPSKEHCVFYVDKMVKRQYEANWIPVGNSKCGKIVGVWILIQGTVFHTLRDTTYTEVNGRIADAYVLIGTPLFLLLFMFYIVKHAYLVCATLMFCVVCLMVSISSPPSVSI